MSMKNAQRGKIGMTGRGKTPPKNGARPLGTARLKPAKKTKAKVLSMAERLATLPDVEPEVRADVDRMIEAKENAADAQKGVDTSVGPEVSSTQQIGSAEPTTSLSAQTTEPGTEKKTMTLVFKNFSKNGRNAFYSGAFVALRFPLSAFTNKTAPSSIEVADGALAPAKEAKVKMTAEERKAARAAKPKPTLAEKIAAREKALDALKAKAAADSL